MPAADLQDLPLRPALVASGSAPFVTGEILHIDGGQSAGH